MKSISLESRKRWKSFEKMFHRVTFRPMNFCEVQDKENSELLARRVFHRDRGRLKRFPADSRHIENDSLGVCLSGGGVRSATFNLGVLQALDEHELLPRVDYLSTVSGGGYIGSSLVWFQHNDSPEHQFPFRRTATRKSKEGQSTEDGTKSEANIEWIRRHASYLTPGNGLDAWALFAAVARGTFVNLLIAVPILFFLIFYASRPWNLSQGSAPQRGSNTQIAIPEDLSLWAAIERQWEVMWERIYWAMVWAYELLFAALAWLGGVIWPWASESILGRAIWAVIRWADGLLAPWMALVFDSGVGFGLSLFAALVLFIYLAARFVLFALVSRLLSSRWTPRTFAEHRESSVQSGMVLKLASILLVFGLVPEIRERLVQLIDAIQWDAQVVTAITTIVGVASIVIGWTTRAGRNETAGWRAHLIKFGLAIVVYGLLLWFHYYSDYVWSDHDIDRSGPTGLHAILAYAVTFSFVLGLLANINRVSMHRYYRNRLLECYMPDNPPAPGEPAEDQDWTADEFALTDIDPGQTGNPCLIINTNLTTLNSNIPRYRIRGGHSFTFTPWHIGSDAISTDPKNVKGWVCTSDYRDGNTNVGTAFSISGAAIDPNTGNTRSGPLAFIMSFLNVRLGYWIRNPMQPPIRWTAWNESPLLWHYYAFREMIGWRLQESRNFVHLSDGGHFENLGLYELIRRKCRFILVSDVSADLNFQFKDLARAVERVRVDFQADIDIGTSVLIPDGDPRTSIRAVVPGKITYDDNTHGKMLFLKATVCRGLPKDIDGYQKTNKNFPHETTIDQFFGDRQFEAYRELGYRLTSSIFDFPRQKTLDELFDMDLPPESDSPNNNEAPSSASTSDGASHPLEKSQDNLK